MDYEDWTVSSDGRSASHSCGWSITVQGNPSEPNEVNPSSVPPGISVLDQARLLRHGIEAIGKAASKKRSNGPAERAKQAAQTFVKDPNRTRKPTLSLKSKKTESSS